MRGIARHVLSIAFLIALVIALPQILIAQNVSPWKKPTGPWMDTKLSADQRAEMIVKEMTLDEKISMVHGDGEAMLAAFNPGMPTRTLGNSGYIPGISRLGIPDMNIADATVGVTHSGRFGRYSTPLPSTLALTASWDVDLAREYGALIGRELRDQGYTMTLGGGLNLPREMRNGRLFEYHGEDPVLAGLMAGAEMKATQDQKIVGDLKHYALNDQENHRDSVDAKISKRAMRETSLLAFEIAVKVANPGGIMCSYNLVNGDYACENAYLMNQVLKKEWGFKGFVLSDWGGTHSTSKAALAGLDLEMPGAKYFGAELKKAVESGEVPMARLDDMVRRILRSEIAAGVFDDPSDRRVPDVFKGLEVAQRVAEQSIVLLKNERAQLPLVASKIRSIAVIGSHADVGVPSGGGSGKVDPIGGNAVPVTTKEGNWLASLFAPTWHRSSPLNAIKAKIPGAEVRYDPGTDIASAVKLARDSEIAIVFVNQLTSEGQDLKSLSLADKQDELVNAVAAANRKTIVVVESGGPVAMPWVDRVSAVLEAWYPGIRGGEAIANVLFGNVNPSAKLAITFPKSDEDLSSQTAQPAATLHRYSISYDEGLLVGYRYFEAKNKAPLFPFGFGLSYTTFSYSDLKATPSKVTVTVKNSGKRAGAETVQVYATLPNAAGEPFKRLVGFAKVSLNPGEAKVVSVELDKLYLSIFNEAKDQWELLPGEYKLQVGGSSRDLPVGAVVQIGQS